MSSTPPPNSSSWLVRACKARSKLSTTGSRALIASEVAKSRNSCCSRAVRLRAFSNSACRRARRSSSVSRSAFSFWTSDPVPAWGLSAGGAEVGSVSSAAGSSCSTSSSSGSTCDFPFVFTIDCLFCVVENFVEEPRDIGDGGHRVLIVDAGRADHSQGPHDFVAHPGRGADQDKIAHGRKRLVEPDYDSHRFLLGVQIGAKQLHDLALLLKSLEHLLQALAILFIGDQVRGSFDEDRLRAWFGLERALLVELLERLHEPVVLAAFLLDAPLKFQARVVHGPAAKIFIDVASCHIQIRLRDVQSQNPIANQSRTRDQHCQHLLVTQAREVHVFQRIFR